MRIGFLLSIILLIILPVSLGAWDFYDTSTEHYMIRSTISSRSCAETGLLMEQLYSSFSEFIGEPDRPVSSLAVIELSTLNEFDRYLAEEWERESDNYILIRQGLAGYTEVIFHRSEGYTDFKSLIHVALFQYIEACNRDTPAWIKQGLARYFETLDWNDKGESLVPFNWGAWEEREALSQEDRPALNDLVNMNEEEMRLKASTTYPECWGLVQYLINASGDEGRLLWECLTLIRMNRRDEWPRTVGPATAGNYEAYWEDMVKPDPLEKELKELYLADYYTKALELIDSEGLSETWLGLYYTGLIHYERGLYADALDEFDAALEENGPRAPILYSSGLSLLELGMRNEGLKRIKEAAGLNRDIIAGEISPLLD